MHSILFRHPTSKTPELEATTSQGVPAPQPELLDSRPGSWIFAPARHTIRTRLHTAAFCAACKQTRIRSGILLRIASSGLFPTLEVAKHRIWGETANRFYRHNAIYGSFYIAPALVRWALLSGLLLLAEAHLCATRFTLRLASQAGAVV